MLTGKGAYVWRIEACEGGNITAIADLAKRANLSHVLVKVADGPVLYNAARNGLGVSNAQLLVQALKASGIQAWGWQYVYGSQPAIEANTAVRLIKDLQLDGFVVNAEVEYKNRPNQAQAYMQALRAGVGDSVCVALSTYRWPTYHMEFPFTQFLERCDLTMPQVYWMQAHNAGYQLRRTLEEYAALKVRRPVFPTGACFREHDWQPTPAEILDFIATAQEENLCGFNFWEWGNARTKVQKGWEVIQNYAWTDPPGSSQQTTPQPASPFGMAARVLVDGLRVRTGPGTNYPVLKSLRKGDQVVYRTVAGADIWCEIAPGEYAAIRTGGRDYMEIIA